MFNNIEASPGRLTVLYDATCGFCTSCRRWLEAQPAYVPLEFVRGGSPQAKRLFPDLSAADGEELVVVGDDGSVYRSTAAWIICLWALQDYRALSARLASPSLYPLARQAFQRVSQNRREISRALALQPEEELAHELQQMPAPACGVTGSSGHGVIENQPLGWRMALRVGLIFVLVWTSLVLLLSHHRAVALWALDRGIVSSRSALVRLGLDPEEALLDAARKGDTATVRSLLDAGADPLRGPGRNALAQAAISGHREVVALLRSAGAEVDAVAPDGETPLMQHAHRGDVAAVRALLGAGADPNARTLELSTPLLFAVRSSAALETVRVLLGAGADPNIPGPRGETTLAASVAFSETDVLCELLAGGAHPNARDEKGATALTLTETRRGNPRTTLSLMAALLQHGADPNLADDNGWTALHYAAQGGDLEAVSLLLASGANAGMETPDGRTPILIAVQTGPRGTSTGSAARLEMVRKLFAADPPARRDQDLSTALLNAQIKHDFPMQSLLRELGAREERSAPKRR